MERGNCSILTRPQTSAYHFILSLAGVELLPSWRLAWGCALGLCWTHDGKTEMTFFC